MEFDNIFPISAFIEISWKVLNMTEFLFCVGVYLKNMLIENVYLNSGSKKRQTMRRIKFAQLDAKNIKTKRKIKILKIGATYISDKN